MLAWPGREFPGAARSQPSQAPLNPAHGLSAMCILSVIGGILGRGKGAAIGSAVGAGTGTAVQVSTKGQQVKVPAETKIDFTLKEPVTVTMDGSQ